MTDPDVVTLRDYMERLIAHEHAWVEARLSAISEAGEIQREELARRLDHLNNEAQRIAARDASFVSKEAFDGHLKAYDEYKSVTSTALSLREGSDRGGASGRALLFSVLSVVVAGASVVIAIAIALAN